MTAQDRYAVTDTRTEDDPACPVWVLAGDDPFAPIGLRAYAAAALATGEVDGDYVEAAYDRAREMDVWLASHQQAVIPAAPPAVPVPTEPADPEPAVQIVEVD